MNVIKSAERLTRRSYKRKIITLGVSIFSALALFATGFASWIISSDATQSSEGNNVSVGVVSDKSITLSAITFKDNIQYISFNPAVGDVKAPEYNDVITEDKGYGGRVYGEDDGDNLTHDFENISLTFSTVITGYDNIADLTIKLIVPPGVKTAAANLAGEGEPESYYITLPVSASDNGVKLITGGAKESMTAAEGADNYWTITDNGDGTHTLNYTMKFSWGNYFGDVNPSLYYDLAANADTIPGYKVASSIEAFRTKLGVAAGSDSVGTFDIVITATASEGTDTQ